MNKRLVIGVGVLSFALAGAVYWARVSAWNRMEEDFRKDMMQECLAVNTKKIVNVLV